MHEAAHLALMPMEVRRKVYGYDSSLWDFKSDELLAIAWGWSACEFLGVDTRYSVPADVVFTLEGKPQTIADCLAYGRLGLRYKGLMDSAHRMRRWHI